jgi:hypothetical protein
VRRHGILGIRGRMSSVSMVHSWFFSSARITAATREPRGAYLSGLGANKLKRPPEMTGFSVGLDAGEVTFRDPVELRTNVLPAE